MIKVGTAVPTIFVMIVAFLDLNRIKRLKRFSYRFCFLSYSYSIYFVPVRHETPGAHKTHGA